MFSEEVISCITRTFQEANVHVSYLAAIHQSPDDNQIVQELHKLTTLTTRVFIVRMSPMFGFRLFAMVKDIGMMSEGYVWILTSEMTNQLASLNSSITDTMQGVLGLGAYFPKTKEFQHFRAGWKSKFQQENPTTLGRELNVYCLWAYDVVTAVAMAVQKAGVKEFVAFKIQIINVFGDGKKVVGFWTPESGLTRKVNSTKTDIGTGQRIHSNLATFVVIIWVFVGLILTQSYTAGLTTLLTVEQLRPAVTDINQLIQSGDYIGHQHGSSIIEFLRKMGFDETKLRVVRSIGESDHLLTLGSRNGGIAAAFAETPYIKVMQSRYCSKYTTIGPSYQSQGFGFVIHL
ncbi:hypothetical protein L6164_023539 [Bauhinia variegata]|uniref:Uncharacterized protein n=1 Tax=Bauhinia variegata TaxID=167791 RepID=A0ACB9MJE2_BAUVA|nr:hypothetical protein L6164_023539 [Bauhinia variegata]